jgi:hypothetical protein
MLNRVGPHPHLGPCGPGRLRRPPAPLRDTRPSWAATPPRSGPFGLGRHSRPRSECRCCRRPAGSQPVDENRARQTSSLVIPGPSKVAIHGRPAARGRQRQCRPGCDHNHRPARNLAGPPDRRCAAPRRRAGRPPWRHRLRVSCSPRLNERPPSRRRGRHERPPSRRRGRHESPPSRRRRRHESPPSRRRSRLCQRGLRRLSASFGWPSCGTASQARPPTALDPRVGADPGDGHAGRGRARHAGRGGMGPRTGDET